MKVTPVVLLDIDDVIFNTGLFIENKRLELIRLTGLDSSLIKEADMAAVDITKKEGFFSIEAYSENLSRILENRLVSREIAQMFEDNKLYRDCLNPDVLPFLTKLQGSYRLGIFSQGDNRLQRLKLEKIRIAKFFEKELIFIYPDKSIQIERTIKQMKIALYIDDSPEEVKEWHDYGIRTIRIKRGRRSERVLEKDLGIEEVTSLDQIKL